MVTKRFSCNIKDFLTLIQSKFSEYGGLMRFELDILKKYQNLTFQDFIVFFYPAINVMGFKLISFDRIKNSLGE